MLSIALLGHVDHGKSTLIGRLVYDTKSLPKEKLEEIENVAKALGQKLEFAHVVDALEEERLEQKTIEASQTFFRTKKREYTLIDVPGHKEYIKNMATGASFAKFGILIVDVTKGIEEQTKRHAFLAKLLGINNVIVVINKMDLVNYEKKKFNLVCREVNELLEKLKLKKIACIPISAYYGDNVVKRSKKMKWYKGKTLVEVLDSLKEKEEKGRATLVVQDNYDGLAFVYLIKGSLRVGQNLTCYPEKKVVKIEEILDGDKKVKGVDAPKAIAIKPNKKVKRGDVLSLSKLNTTSSFRARLFCLDSKIIENKKYKLRLFTQEREVEVKRIESIVSIKDLKERKAKHLKLGDIGIVKLRANHKIVYSNFEEMKELARFVILNRKGQIIAGGVIF